MLTCFLISFSFKRGLSRLIRQKPPQKILVKLSEKELPKDHQTNLAFLFRLRHNPSRRALQKTGKNFSGICKLKEKKNSKAEREKKVKLHEGKSVSWKNLLHSLFSFLPLRNGLNPVFISIRLTFATCWSLMCVMFSHLIFQMTRTGFFLERFPLAAWQNWLVQLVQRRECEDLFVNVLMLLYRTP